MVGRWSAVPGEGQRALLAVDAVNEGRRQLVVADLFKTSPFDGAVDHKSHSTRRLGNCSAGVVDRQCPKEAGARNGSCNT